MIIYNQEAGVDTGEINENQETKEPTDEDIEDGDETEEQIKGA